MPSARALRLLAALALASGAARAGQDGARTVFESEDGTLRVALEERMIGYPDPDPANQKVFMSPDGKSLAMLVLSGGSTSVVYNGEPGESFEGIAEESIRFSPDGSRLAYVGVRESRTFVVVDGILHEHHAIADSGVVFSAEGNRCAWIAIDPNDRQYVVVEGEAHEHYRGIAPRGIVFSPDGSRSAYVALDGEAYRVVVDGVAGPPFDHIVDQWWSPWSNRSAYVGLRGDEHHVVFEGETLAIVDGLGVEGFVFPERADRYAVAVRRDERWSVLVDGEPVGDYASIFYGPRFSADGSRVGFIAGHGDGTSLVIDGEETPLRSPQPYLAFSPDGKHVARLSRGRDVRRILIDDEPHEAFDEILDPGVIFSERGGHSMYRARRGSARFVVHDGVVGPLHRTLVLEPYFAAGDRPVYSIRRKNGVVLVVDQEPTEPYDEVFGPTFSPDGSRFAFVGRRGLEFDVVVDRETVATYPYVGGPPLFGPDGRRLAWVAGRGGRAFAVVDGEEGPSFDFIGPQTLTFTGDGEHLAFCAAVNERPVIVVDDLVIDNGYDGFLRTGQILLEEDGSLAVRAGKRSVWWLVTFEIL